MEDPLVSHGHNLARKGVSRTVAGLDAAPSGWETVGKIASAETIVLGRLMASAETMTPDVVGQQVEASVVVEQVSTPKVLGAFLSI